MENLRRQRSPSRDHSGPLAGCQRRAGERRNRLFRGRRTGVDQRDAKRDTVASGLVWTSHVALQIAFEAVCENPKNFLYISITAAQTIAALESGVVDAALLSPPYDFYAKKKGFREVLNVGTYARMPFGGLTVMTSTLRGRADELKKV